MARLGLLITIPLLTGLAGAGQESHGFGPVAPVVLPDIRATRHDGVEVSLHRVFAGRRSAVQFVFVDCTTACPLLGSIFRKVDQGMVLDDSQLVSITVNPEKDTPERMAEWMRRFQATGRWVGLRVAAADLPVLLTAFQQESGPPSGHTLQVFLVDAAARYIARTTEMPSAANVAGALRPGMLWVGRLEAVAGPREGVGLVTGRDVFEGRGNIVGYVGKDRLEPQAARCSGCHGGNKGGGGEGKTVVPAVSGEMLTTVRPRRGGPASGYTERTFCESLRTGIDPVGVRFSDMMPRYRLDGRTCHQLWEFLAR